MSRRAKTYEGALSRRSMPPRPKCGTRNDYRNWMAAYQCSRARGTELLFDKYNIRESGIDGAYDELSRLKMLLYALAHDHVPYFSTRLKKGSKWDRYVRARFVRDVVAGLKKRKFMAAAIEGARNHLPSEMKRATASALKKQYTLSVKFFQHEVKVTKEFNIVPVSPIMGRLWESDLSGPAPIKGRVMPDPENPDQMLVELDD